MKRKQLISIFTGFIFFFFLLMLAASPIPPAKSTQVVRGDYWENSPALKGTQYREDVAFAAVPFKNNGLGSGFVWGERSGAVGQDADRVEISGEENPLPSNGHLNCVPRPDGSIACTIDY